jgi:hypothetical protein
MNGQIADEKAEWKNQSANSVESQEAADPVGAEPERLRNRYNGNLY